MPQTPNGIEFHFPGAGLDVSGPVCRQPNRPAYRGQYARTVARGINVRSLDADLRYRGGSRCGLAKYVSTQPGGITYVIQSLGLLVTTGGSPVQPSQEGRLVLLWAAQKGVIYFLPAGGTSYITPTNTTGNTPPMDATGVFFGAPNIQKAWFVDGSNAAVYDPATNTLSAWTATSGSFPVDGSGNLPRLVETWRGRTMLSGVEDDPATLFASKVGDPTNFNYAPAVPVPADSAWASTSGPQGQTGDVITALIPYTDDLLIVGMRGHISLFRGDPMAGGQFDLTTTATGIAFGRAWAMDPTGVVYFFGSRGGVFGYVPGNQPQRISTAIDSLLVDVNTGENAISMAWDERRKELRTYITLLTTQQANTHYVYEAQTNSWWQEIRANTAMNPLCCVAMDGNLPGDRVIIEGHWDGYLRCMTPEATDDDGTPIESNVFVGPFLTNLADDVMVSELQAVLAEDSDDVTFAVYIGKTGEAALASSPIVTGTWSAGRNYTSLVRRTAHALYVQITSTGRWAMESVRVKLATSGKVRQRDKGN